MSGLIYEHTYVASVERLRKEFDWADRVIEAIEWGLEQRTDFSWTKLLCVTDRGETRYVQSEPSEYAPTLVAIFTFEETGGTRKVVLHDVKVVEPDDV
jgi:hypothetical protein